MRKDRIQVGESMALKITKQDEHMCEWINERLKNGETQADILRAALHSSYEQQGSPTLPAGTNKARVLRWFASLLGLAPGDVITFDSPDLPTPAAVQQMAAGERVDLSQVAQMGRQFLDDD